MKTKSGIAPLLDNIGTKKCLKFSDKDKANILQRQFTSVFTKEQNDSIPSLGTLTNNNVSDITISKEQILELAKAINVKKSPGPDEIHPKMLVELANELSGPLTILFNKSLNTGVVPNDWKLAQVSPIFKKGAKDKAENYRPISLTSIVCKLMEKIIKERVMKHLTDNDLLSKKQHGFMKGRSTVTQLLNFFDDCVEQVSNGFVVDTVYFDFSKAFDTVPHKRLMNKLQSYGISGHIQRWIKSFLTGRSQFVKVNDEISECLPVISGVPQGSVLGPLLFIIFINDLPEIVTSSIYLFADDTKLMRKITSKHEADALQKDIDALEAWAKKWLLKFNIDKCHVLTLGNFENTQYTKRYKLNGKEIEHVFEEKDLGVHIDSELSFDKHVSTIVNKANSIVGLIRRSFSHLDGPLFKKLYTCFVRPHLEYAQSVWSPYLMKHKRSIENVQIRATKLINGFSNLTYKERLQKIGLPTLNYRRERGDMIELYKHFHTYDKAVITKKFQPRMRPSRAHDHQLVEYIPNDGSHGCQQNSFYYRTIRTWNNLPKIVVQAPNINTFKRELDRAWEEKDSNFEI